VYSTSKPKNRKQFNNSPKMTCIIGGKCIDGVVLVADKKIVDEKSNLVEYKEKLFIFQRESFYYPIVVGSSGTIPLYDKFKREAIETIQEINPVPPPFDYRNFNAGNFQVSGRIYFYSSDTSKEVTLYPYLKKLEDIIKKYKKEYISRGFDVLFAAQVQHKGAVLSHIREDGLSDDINGFTAIGSGGPAAIVFLKGLYQTDFTMSRLAKIGFFIIKYIEEQGIDNNVGVGKDKPQIYFIPNEGPLTPASDNFLTECEDDKKTIAENFKNILPK
jgi:20S proteasome alpha/beta subunit